MFHPGDLVQYSQKGFQLGLTRKQKSGTVVKLYGNVAEVLWEGRRTTSWYTEEVIELVCRGRMEIGSLVGPVIQDGQKFWQVYP